MQIPNSDTIAMAADELLQLTEFEKTDQLKELHSAIGASVAKRLGVAYPSTEDYQVAYLLGVQTARVIVRSSSALILKGVNPEDVL
jgi:hypothetical protein